MFERKKAKNGTWNRQNVAEIAKTFSSRSEFKTKKSGAYGFAKKQGNDYLNKISSHMQNPKKHSKEAIIEVAKKYTTKSEFKKNAGGHFQSAKRQNIFEEVTSNMISPVKTTGYWKNYENCKKEALKHSKIVDLQNGCGGCYKSILDNGWTELYEHMETIQRPHGYWQNYENCKCAVEECETLADLYEKYPACPPNIYKYGFSQLLENLERGCVPRGFWRNYENCKETALQFTKLTDLIDRYPRCYSSILDNDWPELFEHIDESLYGFQKDKPAILYYLKIEHRIGTFFKIGITNRTIEQRFCNDDLNNITILKTINFDRGIDCKQKEKSILTMHENHRYKGGDSILKNGNTELFTKDVMGWA